jgi:hypothetical protein
MRRTRELTTPASAATRRFAQPAARGKPYPGQAKIGRKDVATRATAEAVRFEPVDGAEMAPESDAGPALYGGGHMQEEILEVNTGVTMATPSAEVAK